jgi:cytochrome c-type biogenesis protein CcmH/NrfG
MITSDSAGAKVQIQAVLDRAPDNPQALVYMASILLADGDAAAAATLWEHARATNPDAVQPLVLLARFHRG